MFRSLRFRLPALFLAGIAVAGIVSAVIALRLFQGYTRNESLKELTREATGLTQLYAQAAIQAIDEGGSAPNLVGRQLEKATGDRLFYVGVPIFPGQQSGLTQLPRDTVDWATLQAGHATTFEFTPPGEHRTFLAVANPLRPEDKGPVFGALVVAK